MIDISIQPKNRTGEPNILLDTPEIQQKIELDLHANNYRDGHWGSIRHIVVKEGILI